MPLKGAAARLHLIKRELEFTTKKITDLEDFIRQAPARLEQAQHDLAKAKATAREQQEKARREEIKANAERYAEMAGELKDLTSRGDKQGMTPEAEQRIVAILAEFRLAKLSGQSSERLRLHIESLKNPAAGVRGRGLTWSQLCQWVKLPEAEAA